MKFMKASLEEFKNESIKPVDYLIQNVDDSNFLVHREVKENELHGYKKKKYFNMKVSLF
ncbi:hypothetical protein QUF88_00475 [Bacillus sp. DX1.1]|uniref:hypothetical protein n=1 Tax=Bacillus sp. DX1.1 TaxID=3055866 RepID=UPI0025A05838|nr:hypothetical protein [Bacillus sp. DX1.1]MDM5152538.1 hypothetical protein [Bacillus sp. DX1.1]